MPEFNQISRRTVLGGFAASALAAAAGGLTLPSSAQAKPTAGFGPDADGLRSGYRTTLRTRLATLEVDAGLDPIPPHDRFREWTRERVRRIERLRGVEPGGQLDDPWRVWINDRVTQVESFLPAALRFPFYTHMPLDVPGDQYGPFLRSRIAEGSCNGVFLYGSPGVPMAPTGIMDSITNSGGPVPILMSPKNVSDPVKLAAWMDYWAARPEWIPYIRVAYWQEPQGDFGGEGQPPLSVWHDNVNILADAADRVGIASAAHVETWHLHPVYQPDGGIPRLLQLLQPVVQRLGGGISWSVFVFNEKPDAANDYVRWMDEFMAQYFPWSVYGASAYGDSVPPELPDGDPRRIARAARAASAFVDLDGSRARYGGYYALPTGPDPRRNFWDVPVKAEAVEAVDDLGDGRRLAGLRDRDRAVLRAAEAAGIA